MSYFYFIGIIIANLFRNYLLNFGISMLIIRIYPYILISYHKWCKTSFINLNTVTFNLNHVKPIRCKPYIIYILVYIFNLTVKNNHIITYECAKIMYWTLRYLFFKFLIWQFDEICILYNRLFPIFPHAFKFSNLCSSSYDDFIVFIFYFICSKFHLNTSTIATNWNLF